MLPWSSYVATCVRGVAILSGSTKPLVANDFLRVPNPKTEPPVSQVLYTSLSENACRQYINSEMVWREYLRTKARAVPYAGGMYWKKEGAYEYLVQTHSGNKQTRIGRRTADLERVYQEFHKHKKEVESRLSSLTRALNDAQRENKALRVGRVPPVVVAVLNALTSLPGPFTVLGTAALYAYETAAAIRVPKDLLVAPGPQLQAARQCLCFAASELPDLDKLLGILQLADPTFQWAETRPATAVNAKGFEVKFLAAGALGATTRALPAFKHAIVSGTGRMATMVALAPEAFVALKVEQANNLTWPALVRERYQLQASLVQSLLDNWMVLKTSTDKSALLP